MRTQSEPPGSSVDGGGEQQSLPSSPASSAYKGAWCTPPRIFMDNPDEIIPHLEKGRLPSIVDPYTLPEGSKRLPPGQVRISAWNLANLDSNEAMKAAAKPEHLPPCSAQSNPLGTSLTTLIISRAATSVSRAAP
ncbi:unnamed protein product [Linum trigynum]|uniref:Uncharacterized protein n=1 Tax=Linum trigynum TaxID=586398 RepID=A0AAV2CFU8_9ROSI